MSAGGVDRLLASAGLDARLIAELLWLARDPPLDVPDRAERVGAAVASDEPAVPERPGARSSGTASGEDGERADAAPPIPMYPPARARARGTGGAGAGAPMRKVAFPGASPLPNAMELARALRRFKGLTRPGPPEVDVDATVQATAEARAHASDHLMIRMRSHPVRSLDFALVTDTSASMRVWRPLFDRLEKVFARLGAFRTVSRWTLGVDENAEVYLADPSGAKGRPGRLLDLSGSRIVLIATDAVAEHWYDAAVWKEIDGWARAMPTTLLHMLPTDYWPDTAVGVPYTAARCTGELCPNGGFDVEWGWWAERRRNPALPVIGLCRDDFARWSEALVSGTAWIQGITTAGPVPDDEPDDEEEEVDREEEQEILVDAFFQRASPGAVRLAQLLSCATTLTLPLIGVLQSQLAKDTGLVERAELFVSGLLEEIGDEPDELYAFVPAARRRLALGLSALDEWDIVRAVNAHIERHDGMGGDFTAFVRDREGEEVGAYVRPFAQLARNVAVRRGIAPPEWAETDGSAEDSTPIAVVPPWRPPVPVRTGTGAPVEVLGEQLARLGPSELLVLLDIGQSGSTVHHVRRDDTGVLRATRRPAFGWADRGVSRRVEREAGTGDVFVLATTTTETGLADAARRALPESRPDAVDLVVPGVSIGAALREAVEREPIRQPYALLALEEDTGGASSGGGGFHFRTVPVFPEGAARDDAKDLDLTIAPSDEHGTVLAVVATGPDGTDRTVAVRSVKVPPGRYRVTAELEAPGKVRFRGLPESEPEDRSWESLTGGGSPFVVRLQPAHLICALEYSGPRHAVDERVHRVRQLLNLLWREAGDGLRVSLLFYGAHLYRYRAEDDPPVGQVTWRVSTEEAIDQLDDFAASPPFPTGNPDGAMVEDMLAFVRRALGADRRFERMALLTVGDRPPHPASVHPSETLPCPRGHDWVDEMAGLRRRDLKFAAICDRPTGRGRSADEAWRRLGGSKPFRLDVVDVAAVGRRLGLVPSDAQRVPFPIVVQT